MYLSCHQSASNCRDNRKTNKNVCAEQYCEGHHMAVIEFCSSNCEVTLTIFQTNLKTFVLFLILALSRKHVTFLSSAPLNTIHCKICEYR
jgi:hypothetical protein